MYRSMFQVYVKGSAAAAEFYQRAFDAKLTCAYPNEKGEYMHSELDVYGQVLAISESTKPEQLPGNTMQFCLHFGGGESNKVHKAYEVLKEGAVIDYPIGSVDYSPCMFSLIDKFGVYWCIFE